MPQLSVVILTRNETENIVDCVRSCLFADEILIIDDNSTDGTCELALSVSEKVKVLPRSLGGDWAQQRNFGLEQAAGDFILFIDADERVTPELASSVRKAIEAENAKAVFSFLRVNNLVDSNPRHGIFRPDWVTRLLPKGGGKYERKVHERLLSPLPTRRISGQLIHHTYRDWESYWNKFNKYTQISAEATTPRENTWIFSETSFASLFGLFSKFTSSILAFWTGAWVGCSHSTT